MNDLYHSAPNPTGKVNRRAIASQRVTSEDRVQRVILLCVAATLVGAGVLLALGMTVALVTWPTLGIVLGLAIAFQWRAHIVARWQPHTRPESDEPSWRPTGRLR